jgi:hypothetical protein
MSSRAKWLGGDITLSLPRACNHYSYVSIVIFSSLGVETATASSNEWYKLTLLLTPLQLHSGTCNKPVNKFYSCQQRVTQSQQLEMGLTAREEN